MNVVVCDGGLCNRLNALVFALILKRKYQRVEAVAQAAIADHYVHGDTAAATPALTLTQENPITVLASTSR